MKVTLWLLALGLLAGCTSTPPSPGAKPTLAETVQKRNIVKGKTSQVEVVQLLGSPNIVHKNPQGEEIWTYTKQSFEPETNMYGGSIALSGGSTIQPATNSGNCDLVLTFDKTELVTAYSVIPSQL